MSNSPLWKWALPTRAVQQIAPPRQPGAKSSYRSAVTGATDVAQHFGRSELGLPAGFLTLKLANRCSIRRVQGSRRSVAPRRIGERVFPIAQKYAPRTILVTDETIAEAQKILWRALRIVAASGGACAFSAITSGAYKPATGERVAVVISGGNTTAVDFG